MSNGREKTLPLVQVHMLEGRTEEQKKRMIIEVTEAIARTLNAPKENIRIAIYELPKSHWSVGGVTMDEK
ncbi:4-oxalocrotonate tautomerase [Geobacillus proteiniphilus]|uniref:Tautomerase n=1 Tax=Geobacillus proteiniphilus TaxID=860353 RepID=A0ABY9MLB6_9BACL|nr:MULTISPECIES: 4-oxalocrotonate tautomerase [Geobacillus]OPX04565.1 4-oxalocrotonate tautomerase [Geobacillus sp. LEMMY01]WMJ18404.1 4-oxalocrotonate tautomerase [Geobacillus proteiniphilus]